MGLNACFYHYSFPYTSEHMLRSHSCTFESDGLSEVVVTDTGRKKGAIGAGGTPVIHPSEPGKLAQPSFTVHGKSHTTVGVLWGPDSFLFRSDRLSKFCPKYVHKFNG